jgi:site-specific recombinase XerD
LSRRRISHFLTYESHLASWPITRFFWNGWQQVHRLIKRIGERAGFAVPVHAHMVRHSCGYALANAGHDTPRAQDWLRHRSIQHTTRYTQLSAAPFKDFWR